ncbi:MAG: hypothetical protein CSA62_11015 [Planctomycetota bacterium]|nr:MAG: hypothetical protein CSA62_11015 [Planctomycetota bacterium]
MDRRKTQQGGFTLIEILVALAILGLGVGTAVGGFVRGATTQAQGVLVRDASRIAEIVQERLRSEDLLGRDFDARPQDLLDQKLVGYPGLRYDLVFEGEVQLGFPLYVRLTVRWLSRGQEVSEIFRFPLPRGASLPARIRAAQESSR